MDIMKSLKAFAVSLVLCAGAAAQVQQFIPANTVVGNNSGASAPAKPLTVSQVNTLLGINANSIPIGQTLAQLNAAYPASNYGSNVVVPTIDEGLVQSNGTSWISGIHYPLLQSAVPVIIAPSGTMANNCAFTLSTALDATYQSAFIQLPTNAIYTGSSPALPYASMSSTT